MADVKNSEKEREINRILSCIRINPVDILQISLDLDEKNIKKQYRKLSLLVHPDRCPQELKERAQRAFTMLNNTKKDLESKEFMVKLKHQINEARRRVNERKMIQKGQRFIDEQDKFISMEPSAKKQRTESTLDISSAKPPQTEDYNDEQKKATNKEILIQLKEILIDCEWQKRITEQASQKIEQQTLQRREELKAKIAAQKQYKKEWEEGRDSRVSNWRDWQTKDKKKKKKKKKKNKLKK